MNINDKRLLLAEQAAYDERHFDPEDGYAILDSRDQKIRHIQLHVAKAAGKLYKAMINVEDQGYELVEAEAMPDIAMYRTQIINAFRSNFQGSPEREYIQGAKEREGVLLPENPRMSVLLEAVLQTTGASAALATYIERREHRPVTEERSPFINQAVARLNIAAECLAEHYGVDLAEAQRERMASQASQFVSAIAPDEY